MWALTPLTAILYASTMISSVMSLGSTCSAPLGAGTAAAGAPFWLETITKRGTSAFNANPSSYKPFRNVKDYGAKGDGSTDDTAAINAAIADGSRCGIGCESSTLTPALVYFPAGTYVISSSVVIWYYTQFVGDARNPPTIAASANFPSTWMIDADPYLGGDAQWYQNQNNFFRSIRNLVFDMTRVPPSVGVTGIHWQVSQATSLINVRFEMSRDPATQHQGMFMENGSGGFMGDLTVNGGKLGLWLGNQQFTVRNLKIDGAITGIFTGWNWGWNFQGLTINNTQVGMQINTGGTTINTQTTGAEAIIDAEIYNTPVFIQTTTAQRTSLSGSLLLDNLKLTNVPVAVADPQGTVLAGGTTTIAQWAQGNVYSGSSGTPTYVQAQLTPPNKPASLLQNGKIVSRSRPQYTDYAVDQFVSVKAEGAAGDGNTDDTAAIQAVFAKYAGCKIIFFDAGTYMVSNTIVIPAGAQVVGEIWTQILGFGSHFSDISNPQVVIKVGDEGSKGILEITDMVFGVRGPTPGAIVVEWNAHDSDGSQAVVGAWDTHVRLGSSAGTNLGSAECVKLVDHGTTCFAAYMAFHLTENSSAYLEGLWVWLGDHDLDGDHQQVTVYSGRGLLSQSQGPVWLIGTGSEHHALYQYAFVGAQSHYMGQLQTESPYYQPTPAPPAPFTLNTALGDPDFSGNQTSAWGLYIRNSNDLLIYAAGLYSFFVNYNGDDCVKTVSCQNEIVSIDTQSTVSLYSLSTVGVVYQLSFNGAPVIVNTKNLDGFQETVTAWTQTSSLTKRHHPARARLPKSNF